MKYALLLAFLSLPVFAAPVKLNFTQTMGKTGKVYFAVFNSSSQFPKGKPVTSGSVSVAGEREASFLVDLPAGDYAVSIFLDENNNGKLDQNFIGIPTERFGFSNNPRILTGAPSYNDCLIRVLDQENDFTIRLIKLF